MYIDDIRKLCPACRNIDFYLGKRASEGISIGFRLISTLRRQMTVVRQTVQLLHRQIGKAHQNLSVPSAYDFTIDNIQTFLCMSRQLLCGIQNMAL